MSEVPTNAVVAMRIHMFNTSEFPTTIVSPCNLVPCRVCCVRNLVENFIPLLASCESTYTSPIVDAANWIMFVTVSSSIAMHNGSLHDFVP